MGSKPISPIVQPITINNNKSGVVKEPKETFHDEVQRMKYEKSDQKFKEKSSQAKEAIQNALKNLHKNQLLTTGEIRSFTNQTQSLSYRQNNNSNEKNKKSMKIKAYKVNSTIDRNNSLEQLVEKRVKKESHKIKTVVNQEDESNAVKKYLHAATKRSTKSMAQNYSNSYHNKQVNSVLTDQKYESSFHDKKKRVKQKDGQSVNMNKLKIIYNYRNISDIPIANAKDKKYNKNQRYQTTIQDIQEQNLENF